MSKEYYKPGDWWVLCDQCQRKMRASESIKRWDGLIVHADPSEGCWETRHPQDFVRPVPDNDPIPFVRTDNDGLEATLTTNCNAMTFLDLEPIQFEALLTVYKGRVRGPLQVPSTTTIVCTLEVY